MKQIKEKINQLTLDILIVLLLNENGLTRIPIRNAVQSRSSRQNKSRNAAKISKRDIDPFR